MVAYEALPERTSEVIRLRRVEGASQRETACAVGVTESAIEKHLRRGLRLVRAEVSGDAFEFVSGGDGVPVADAAPVGAGA